MIRGFLFLLALLVLSCWPGACHRAPMTEPEPDEPDTALAVSPCQEYPDLKPPKAP